MPKTTSYRAAYKSHMAAYQPQLKESGAMPRKKTKVAGYQPITIRFPPPMLAEVRAVADAEERSANEQVIYMLKQWLTARSTLRAQRALDMLDDEGFDALEHQQVHGGEA